MQSKVTKMLIREEFNRERVEELIREARKHGPFHALSHDEREATRHEYLAHHAQGQDLWVFGYGSLLWNPAFHYVDCQPARLFGYRRRFCLQSSIGRGSKERPGLMLALDRGGSCNGRAFRIESKKIESETEILWMREMISGSYDAKMVRMKLPHKTVSGLTFVMNRHHPRYIDKLDMEATAKLLATGEGHLGTCREYLMNTIAHLEEMEVKDKYLHQLASKVQEIDDVS
ncbi:gamma-glutamylcyclotransferase [Sneathiella marina]|uniref:glutathione-specific gamma-glutamylcyclotransferase n=1 Tax=Sneathiella marina TaxID=2950108 RepID=A0ABY4W4N3_9PROT|nr:gamma-glutamylcyclotransferase [Sneathiella marina]USG61869.1 gamma-glutamylcyclotransferase [Sneathiella marina]